jgi:hypothetical protein
MQNAWLHLFTLTNLNFGLITKFRNLPFDCAVLNLSATDI